MDEDDDAPAAPGDDAARERWPLLEDDDAPATVVARAMDAPKQRDVAGARDDGMLGFYLQYFAVGVIYGGLPSTVYGFFLGYLNVEGYVYATAATIITMPWSFKFFFGAINDCFPIAGYRRKPYMVFGWALCAAALLRLATLPLPPPYWCVEGRAYVRTVETADGGVEAAEPCNPDAAKAGGGYALLMMVAALGYCLADVAADGLTVQLARAESEKTRGRTQTTVYLVRTLGNVVATAVVGLCMNSWEYNGSFDRGLGFPAVMGLFALPAAAMVPVSWLLVKETKVIFLDPPLHADRKKAYEDRRTIAEYCGQVWELLRGRAMLSVILFQFCGTVIGGISTTASGEVKQYWAGVKTFQNACFSLVGLALFAAGLSLVRARFLGASWRLMLAATTIFLNVVDAPFAFFTIFDVVRNQYFYLGETVLVEIPAAANFVVATFVIVEMAEGGDEGVVYGLLTTTANLGGPFAQAISNQLFGLWRPSLSNSANYIEDSASFRRSVAWSFAISYFFSFLSLATLPLLPDQKAQAQERKRTWEKRDAYAYASLSIVGFGLLYSVTVNSLAMFPATMCLKLAGGDGCG